VLGAAEVDLWRANLDAVGARQAGELAAVLSPEERRQAGRFVFAPDRRRFTLARAILREVLGRYLGHDPAGIPLARTPHGKPCLAVPGARLRFNVSHSAELALLAVAGDREVGVDVERIQPALTEEILGWHLFGAAERERARALSPAARDRAASAAWTRWEAYAKARGVGLAGLEPSAEIEPGWSVHEIEVGPGWAAALAVAGPPGRVRYCGWEAGAAVSAR
jgi:4'-phosphopantetheinyl transferase